VQLKADACLSGHEETMITEITDAITRMIPNARVTWCKNGNIWSFSVRIPNPVNLMVFKVAPHNLESPFPKEPYLREAQAIEIAFLICGDYQRWLNESLGRKTVMRCYAIYDHPTDYPNHWVVRGWEVIDGLKEPQPDAEPILCEDVEEARNHVRKLLPYALLIDTKDPDPHLFEVWGSGQS
jgi:hypothetical protein